MQNFIELTIYPTIGEPERMLFIRGRGNFGSAKKGPDERHLMEPREVPAELSCAENHAHFCMGQLGIRYSLTVKQTETDPGQIDIFESLKRGKEALA